MRNRLAIFTFHRVLERPDPFRPGDPSIDRFECICRWISKYFHAFPLSEAVHRLINGNLPARSVAITFDDGYADNAEIAAPVLEKFELNATFFIATGFLGNGRLMFNDEVIEALRGSPRDRVDLSGLALGIRDISTERSRLSLLPDLIRTLKHLPVREREEQVEALRHSLHAPSPPKLMMTHAQVASLTRRGMEIGGHTVTHPVLTTMSIDDAGREIAEGREFLQDITQTPVDTFAYPNGRPGADYAPAHVLAVRAAGFRCAVTTAWGCARRDDDLFQLPRMTIWDHRPVRSVPRVLRAYLFGGRGAHV